jgi:hypothetical protein
VKKFDGNAWVAISDITLPNKPIYSTSIAVDSDNKPYVVYKENTSSLLIKKFDGISWININSSTILGDTSNPKLFIDKNIIPNILYLSYGNWNNQISLAKFTNGAWRYISGVGSIVKLKNNKLYSLFKSSNTVLEIKKFNGTNWERVQNALTNIDINDNLVDLYLTSDSYLILKRNINTDKLSLNKFDGSVWSTIGSNDFNSGKSSFAKLSLLNNLPVVVYSADKGCFAKYFGSPDALNTSNFMTNNEFSTIYPNPIINTFKIKSDLSINEIFIYNLSGKKVFESKNIMGEINVDFLPKGLYLLKIITKDRFGTVKLIKE